MAQGTDGTTAAGDRGDEADAVADSPGPAERLARLLACLGDAPVPVEAVRATLGPTAEEAIASAVDRGWVRRSAAGVHGAAKLPARSRVPDRTAAAEAGRLLEAAVPADPEDPAAGAAFRALRPHALPALEAARTAGAPLDPALLAVVRIGARAAAAGEPEVAAGLLGAAAQLLGTGVGRAEGGPLENPFLAALLEDQLAAALQDLGRPAEAREAALRAEAAARGACGPADPRLPAMLVNVGTIYKRQGDWPTAEVHFRRALERAEAIRPEAGPLVGAIRLNLCDVLRAQGRPAEARAFAERALRDTERALGPMHRGTADAAETLALVLEELGEDDAAAPLWRRVAALYERQLGPEHPMARAAARRATAREDATDETRGGASP